MGNFFGGQVFGGGFFGAITTTTIDHGGRVRIQRERERAADEELIGIIQRMAPDVFNYFDHQP